MSAEKKKPGKIGMIKDYFGFRPGDTAKDFMEEIKALSSEERTELAILSANAMGLTQAQVDFDLAS